MDSFASVTNYVAWMHLFGCCPMQMCLIRYGTCIDVTCVSVLHVLGKVQKNKKKRNRGRRKAKKKMGTEKEEEEKGEGARLVVTEGGKALSL